MTKLTKPIWDLTPSEAMCVYSFIKRTGNTIQGLDDPEDLVLVATGLGPMVKSSYAPMARQTARFVKCAMCFMAFTAPRSSAKYCSDACKVKAARKRYANS